MYRWICFHYFGIFFPILSLSAILYIESIPRQSYETLQKQLGDLQTMLTGYLKQEEEALEIRIRYGSDRHLDFCFKQLL